MIKFLLLIPSLILFLTACGGGGGGGGSSAGSATNWTTPKCTSSYLNDDGVMVPCAYQTFNTTENGTTGSYNPDDYEQEDFGGWTGTFVSESETENYAYYEGCYNDFGSSDFNDPDQCDVSWNTGEKGIWRGSTDVTAADSVSYYFDVPMNHMTDTGATTAWSQGWTGQGTNINIIDDASWNAINIDVGNYQL